MLQHQTPRTAAQGIIAAQRMQATAAQLSNRPVPPSTPVQTPSQATQAQQALARARSQSQPSQQQPASRPAPAAPVNPATQGLQTVLGPSDLTRRCDQAVAATEVRRQAARDDVLAAKKAFHELLSPDEKEESACKKDIARALGRYQACADQSRLLCQHLDTLRDAQVALEEHLLMFEAGQRVEALRSGARRQRDAFASASAATDGAAIEELMRQFERGRILAQD